MNEQANEMNGISGRSPAPEVALNQSINDRYERATAGASAARLAVAIMPAQHFHRIWWIDEAVFTHSSFVARLRAASCEEGGPVWHSNKQVLVVNWIWTSLRMNSNPFAYILGGYLCDVQCQSCIVRESRGWKIEYIAQVSK